MGLRDADVTTLEQRTGPFQHTHELQHQNVCVGTQHDREVRMKTFKRRACGELNEHRRCSLAETGDAADLAARTRMNNNGVALRYGFAWPCSDNAFVVRRQMIAQLCRELPSASNENLHLLFFRENVKYRTWPMSVKSVETMPGSTDSSDGPYPKRQHDRDG